MIEVFTNIYREEMNIFKKSPCADLKLNKLIGHAE
tara:strand:+ start:29615 stop:29719 length:105 start_codon:yes stop_codon:yes gene_type:complete